jgi:hypothetical protein
MGTRVLLCYGERQMLICNAPVSLPKKGNLERHYNALHSNKYDVDFPPKSESRKLKLIALKIVNSICRKSLQRRLFNLTLEKGTPDVTLHTDVSWLSKYKFLQRFRSMLSEIIF